MQSTYMNPQSELILYRVQNKTQSKTQQLKRALTERQMLNI